ncbi:MAG: PAS domain S-box protein [Chitinophagia bacterium]|nr:PAS domain S-box protein [Chitinophagia bacterium]
METQVTNLVLETGNLQPQREELVHLPELDSLARLVAESSGVPFALICLNGTPARRLCGSYGLPLTEVPQHFLYNLYTAGDEQIFEVADTLTDIRFSQNILVTGSNGIRYFAGIAVTDGMGGEAGAIGILSPAAHMLDNHQKEQIKKLAKITSMVWQADAHQREANAYKYLLGRYSVFAVAGADLAIHFATESFQQLFPAQQGYEAQPVLITELLQTTKDEKATLLQKLQKNEVFLLEREHPQDQKQYAVSIVPFYEGGGMLQNVFVYASDQHNAEHLMQELDLSESFGKTGIWHFYPKTGMHQWSKGMYRIVDADPGKPKSPAESIFDYVAQDNLEEVDELNLGEQVLDLPLNITVKRITRKQRLEAGDHLLFAGTTGNNNANTIEFRIRTRTGAEKVLAAVIKHETNENGTITKVTGICKDITGGATAIAETPAVAPAAEVRESGRIGRIVTQPDGTITTTNQTLLQWAGKEADDVLQTPLRQLLPGANGSLNRILDQLANGQPAGDLITNITNGSNTTTVLLQPEGQYAATGELQSIQWCITDITALRNEEIALRASEQEYRSLIEESPLMLFIADVQGRFTFVNKRFKKIIGYDDRDLLGHPFASIYHGEWRKKAIAFYQKQLLDKTDETTFIFPITVKNGQKLWIEQVCTLMKQGDAVTGYRCALLDITERLKTQEAMEEAARLATEAKEMQQTFLGKMSHEIRTPMNGVVGMVNLLHTTRLTPEQKEFLDGIKESSVNMIRIINDILDVTKIQSGKLIFEETEFVLKNLVNSVIFNLKAVAEEKDIQLLSQIDSQVPDMVIADPVRLNQILLNLAGNALKFTDKGSVSITVLYKEMKNERLTLEFIIADTGIGIPQNKINAIFESFTQAQSDTTRKYGGTGLGLTIAKQLIEQQGGEIKVNSKVGYGTTFTFSFHFKLNKKTQLATNGRKDDAKIADLTGAKILLVEDNVMNQRVAKYTIEKWGAAVTIAESGFRALDLMEKEPYDLVLMDIQMPDMNGLQTTYKIRKELKKVTPIVAMTASVMQGERENCMKAGMNEYISKPFNPLELNQKIYNFIKPQQKESHRRIINIDYLKSAVGGETGAIREILEIYLSKTPALLEGIERDLNNGQFEALRQQVHNLKNSVGVLGADRLFHLIDTIEFSLTEGRPSVDVMAMLSQMRQLVRQSIAEVEDEYRML